MTYILSSANTPRVIDPDIPLVQSGDSKSGLSLFLRQTGVFKISNSPTSKFEQPGYGRPSQQTMLVICALGSESLEGSGGEGNQGEKRTATDGCVRKFYNGLVDHFIRERSDKRRTDEPLPSSCRRSMGVHIRTWYTNCSSDFTDV